MHKLRRINEATVLVIAYACEPDKGSEPGVGWKWVKMISEIVGKVYVITKGNNQDSIKREISENPLPNVRFFYYELPRTLTFWKKGQRGVRTYYYLWQMGALKYIRKKIKLENITFDLVHHVTFVNDWLPSFFWKLGKPFVWGPIGSNDEYPTFLFERKKDFIMDRLRIFIQNLFRNIDPNFKSAIKKSNAIIGINNSVRKKLNLCKEKPFFVIPAIGVESLSDNKVSKLNKKSSNKKIIVSVGRFIYFKSFPLTIRAFSMFNKKYPNSELWLIGKGDQENYLRTLVNKLGLKNKVKFLGWKSRNEVIEFMKNADVFLYPSLEGGGMVVLEAIENDLPVLCLNRGGPSYFVNEELQIDLDGKKNEIVSFLSSKMELIFKINRLISINQDFCALTSWSSKQEKLNLIYSSILLGEKQ